MKVCKPPHEYANLFMRADLAGLSLLFFLLSLTGNFTYGVSLIAYSQDKEYLITTIPWLLGSLGTMVEDSAIFVQFRLYANNARNVGGI